MIGTLVRTSGLACMLLLGACGGGGGGGTGNASVTVPNVVGLTQAGATTSITGAGLVLGTVTTQSSATVASGNVISENPAANSSVAAGSAVALVVSSGPLAANALPVVIDAGPAALTNNNLAAANILYASVTICTPGSTTACQTIDHVEIDTGSVGLEILAEVLDGSAVPTPFADPNSGAPLRECVQFADGYTWGSVVVVDVTIGSRSVQNLPVHLIGDAGAGTAPASCVSGAPENTVVQFGANGILGVGNFLQDCGAFCATPPAATGNYYVCPNQTCQPTSVTLDHQVQNPVAKLSAPDNNGVLIQLPSVAPPGAARLDGTLYFGVATQANNALGSATFFTLDQSGDLITKFGTSTLSSSFIDSGSNAYFFNSSITACSGQTASGFYCPAAATPESATIQGINGATRLINFTIDNANNLFGIAATAYPTLGGPNSTPNGPTNSFDWGLPFFFGRKVYVLFEQNTVAGQTGPAVAF